MALESKFQREVIEDIYALLDGCIILKNDPNYLQGVPDLIVLYEDRWATLEVKKSAKASERPNQRYYVELMNEMSFAAFIFPENKEDVLRELQQALRPRRQARVPKR